MQGVQDPLGVFVKQLSRTFQIGPEYWKCLVDDERDAFYCLITDGLCLMDADHAHHLFLAALLKIEMPSNWIAQARVARRHDSISVITNTESQEVERAKATITY